MSIVSGISEAERARQRAMSIATFCERYDIGRTKAYEEIKLKRLRARKCGKRTIITDDDAEDWLNGIRRPYVVTGAYPQTLRGKIGDVPRHIVRQLEDGLRRWLVHPYTDAAKDDRHKNVFSNNVAYFEKELKWFRERW
jgi:hypothetical protein